MDYKRVVANKENLKSLISSVGIEVLVECFGKSVYVRCSEIENGLDSYENEKTLRFWDEYLLENDYYDDEADFIAEIRRAFDRQSRKEVTLSLYKDIAMVNQVLEPFGATTPDRSNRKE